MFKNLRILSTGGGSGLGLELTKQFLSESALVTVYDIKEQPFEDENLSYFQEDLLETIPEGGDYDIFVSNVAYYSGKKDFSDITEDEIKKDIKINIELPLMILKKNKIKKIVFINSILCFQGFTFTSMYAASKSYFHTFNQSLRQDNYDTLIVYPCKIDTPMFKDIKIGSGFSAKYVAEKVLEAIRNNDKQIFIPFYIRILSYVQFFNYRIQDRIDGIFKWLKFY